MVSGFVCFIYVFLSNKNAWWMRLGSVIRYSMLLSVLFVYVVVIVRVLFLLVGLSVCLCL